MSQSPTAAGHPAGTRFARNNARAFAALESEHDIFSKEDVRECERPRFARILGESALSFNW